MKTDAENNNNNKNDFQDNKFKLSAKEKFRENEKISHS